MPKGCGDTARGVNSRDYPAATEIYLPQNSSSVSDSRQSFASRSIGPAIRHQSNCKRDVRETG
jgi:hypothetical protein